MEELIKVPDDINEILQTLKKIKIDINIPTEASTGDKGLYNLLIEGKKEKDYKKVYSFVHSVEIGCGFYSSETVKLSSMYNKAMELNLKTVAEILNDKSEVLDIVYNCYCINKESKLLLLQSTRLVNSFVIFELIRQLINGIQIDELSNSPNCKRILGNGIIELAKLDIKLFQYFIEEFELKKQFPYVMGAALNDMTVSGREVYAKTIRLNAKDRTYYENVRTLLENIEIDKYDSIVNNIKEIIYKRWSEYLEELINGKEFIPDIIINSYADLILSCLCEKYKDEKLFFRDLSNILNEFNKSIYKWYEKGTEFSSAYSIHATKLFFIKKVQEINIISISNKNDIFDKIHHLFDNNRMLHNKYINAENLIPLIDG